MPKVRAARLEQPALDLGPSLQRQLAGLLVGFAVHLGIAVVVDRDDGVLLELGGEGEHALARR